MYGSRLERWERWAEWPLMVSACLFLAAYATQIIAHPHGNIEALAHVLLWATWVVFVADYVIRLVIATNRWRWFYRHLPELAIVILPMLRPLRLLRFVTIITLLHRTGGAKLRGRLLVYSIGASFLITFLAALATLDAEQGGKGPIQDYGQAVWWAFCTVTTVGYGDFYPVTTTGRIVAILLMASGVALIGVVTATLSSWLMQRSAAETDAHDRAEREEHAREHRAHQLEQHEIAALRAELAELKGLLRSRGKEK